MSTRAGVAALVLLLAGCSAPQVGSPARAPGPSAPLVPPASPPPTVTPPTGLAALQACDLLTAQEASSLGMRPQGRAEEILGLRRCDWTTPGGGGVSTSINEKLGIDGLNLTDASRITDVTIGRHRAKRALDGIGPGYCEIDLAVGDTANVSVLALYLNDTARACAVTDRAAVFVESKLP
ncbi:MAG: DUF3558 domain-containing protein [Pseudonocardiales bacterium]|nr:DUF3558 domain-containing protein [Pseudonocardiales bacterium]